jgi:hypothetical protein
MTTETASSARPIVRPITLLGIAVSVVALHMVKTLLLHTEQVPLVARLCGAIATSIDNGIFALLGLPLLLGRPPYKAACKFGLFLTVGMPLLVLAFSGGLGLAVLGAMYPDSLSKTVASWGATMLHHGPSIAIIAAAFVWLGVRRPQKQAALILDTTGDPGRVRAVPRVWIGLAALILAVLVAIGFAMARYRYPTDGGPDGPMSTGAARMITILLSIPFKGACLGIALTPLHWTRAAGRRRFIVAGLGVLVLSTACSLIAQWLILAPHAAARDRLGLGPPFLLEFILPPAVLNAVAFMFYAVLLPKRAWGAPTNIHPHASPE